MNCLTIQRATPQGRLEVPARFVDGPVLRFRRYDVVSETGFDLSGAVEANVGRKVLEVMGRLDWGQALQKLKRGHGHRTLMGVVELSSFKIANLAMHILNCEKYQRAACKFPENGYSNFQRKKNNVRARRSLSRTDNSSKCKQILSSAE